MQRKIQVIMLAAARFGLLTILQFERENPLNDWKTKAEIGKFILTSVLTRPLFSVFSSESTYEKRRGRESNPRIDSPQRIYPIT
jgi:hypothetical protein